MSNKMKSTLYYAAAMAVLLYGMVAMIGAGITWKTMMTLTIWALAYGGLLAGSAYHDGKAVRG